MTNGLIVFIITVSTLTVVHALERRKHRRDGDVDQAQSRSQRTGRGLYGISAPLFLAVVDLEKFTSEWGGVIIFILTAVTVVLIRRSGAESK